jgi:hypothetical protein
MIKMRHNRQSLDKFTVGLFISLLLEIQSMATYDFQARNLPVVRIGPAIVTRKRLRFYPQQSLRQPKLTGTRIAKFSFEFVRSENG